MEPLKITVFCFSDLSRSSLTAPDNAELELIPVPAPASMEKRGAALIHALPQATGDYFTVFNDGDILPENYFSQVAERLRANQKAGRVPELCSVQKLIQSQIDLFSPETEKDQWFDISREYDALPILLNGTFVRNTAGNCALFTDLGWESERIFLLKLLLKHNVLFYIGTVVYDTCVLTDEQHLYYPGAYSRRWYLDSFEQGYIPLLESFETEEPPHFIQYYILFAIRRRFDANKLNSNKHVLSESEIDRMLELFRQCLQMISERHIVGFCKRTAYSKSSMEVNRMLLRIRAGDPNYNYQFVYRNARMDLICGDIYICGIAKTKMCIDRMEYRNGRLDLDTSINSLFLNPDFRYYVEVGEKRFPLIPHREYNIVKYFGRSAYRRQYFHTSIPLKKLHIPCTLMFTVCYTDMRYVYSLSYATFWGKLSAAARNSYWHFDKYIAQPGKEGIRIHRAKKGEVLLRELRLWGNMFFSKEPWVREQLAIRSRAFLRRQRKKQQIWLFMDKIYKGGDSAEYLYKYAEAQKDGIRKYYLIDKDSPDCQRLINEGYTPLIRGSMEHRVIFLSADVIVISNSTVCAFNDYNLSNSIYVRDMMDFDVVCVQHGMSVQKIAVAQHRLRDNIKLYCCASKYEIQNLSNPVYGYSHTQALQLTGVPRYDGLKDRHKKQIMISPTWRMQAAMPVTKNEGVQRDYNPDFKKTSYYRVYNDLINDPRLLAAAREYGYRIAYVLHPIVSPQAEDFDKNDLVDIIPATGDMSYEQLFCESSLMVTDFSGIQFDFAYMKKPLVYLHHQDVPQHYEEGTFYYDTMAFGEICRDNDSLIDLLCEYMRTGCQMKPEYQARVDDFFHYHDDQNCKRIYSMMQEMFVKHSPPLDSERSAEPAIAEKRAPALTVQDDEGEEETVSEGNDPEGE